MVITSSRVRRLRLPLALLATRVAAFASARLGRGGTSLPGLAGLRLEPDLVRRLGSRLGHGALVVAGTNGKTTTSAMLASALAADARSVLHNRAGSNMLRGIATTLAARSKLNGSLRDGEALTGLFEVDEAALPSVAAQLAPRAVVLTNLFRDQLDRYGELQGIADRWRIAFEALPIETALVVNADDPLVCSLGLVWPGKVVSYGIEDWGAEAAAGELQIAASADSLYCPRCAALLAFSMVSYAHLGRWSCANCGLRRPRPEVRASVQEVSAQGSRLRVETPEASVLLALQLPGRYNVYNALAALAGARAVGVGLEPAARAVASTRGAFGRAEVLQAAGRRLQLFLIKNPTGADEVLRVVAAAPGQATLLALLSDRAADGHDVSWIWDAQFELVQHWEGPVICGGTRAADMALRLKYAGLPGHAAVEAGGEARALRAALAATPEGGSIVVIATYTAMLAARHHLARAGHVAQYWEARV